MPRASLPGRLGPSRPPNPRLHRHSHPRGPTPHSLRFSPTSLSRIRQLNSHPALPPLPSPAPQVKWAAFQEQRRREDVATMKFKGKVAARSAKAANPNPTVDKFLDRLSFKLQRRMKDTGGTELSLIRKTFLNWDADCSGELSAEEFTNAVKTLGLILAPGEAEAVVDFYDGDGSGEMRYQEMVEDIGRKSRHFLSHPNKRSARADDNTPEAKAEARRKLTPFIELFVKKLRRKLQAHMKLHGEYEQILVRRAFLNWDADASGKLGPGELVGAMHQLHVTINADEAAKIVEFYDDGNGEMRYERLVEDVVSGTRHFMTHPEDPLKQPESDRAKGVDEALQTMFTYRNPAHSRTANLAVENFKNDLRQRLDEYIQEPGKGGTVSMSLRDAFLFWDGDNSGKLDAREFRGAMSRIGLQISHDVAKVVVARYDTTGSGEIPYHDLVDDVARGAQHFLDHPSTGRPNGAMASVRKPESVEDTFRAIRRAAEACAARAVTTASVPRLSARELCHGTFLRHDRRGAGAVDRVGLLATLRELRVPLSASDADELAGWFDVDGSFSIPYVQILDSVFGPAPPQVDDAPPRRTQARTRALARYGGSGTLSKAASLPLLAGGTGKSFGATRGPMRKHAMLAERSRIERRIKELGAMARSVDTDLKRMGGQ